MEKTMSAVLVVCLAVASLASAGDVWTHRGRDASRNSAVEAAPPSIAVPRFVATAGDIELVGQSAPVVADHKVFVCGRRTTIVNRTQTVVTDMLVAFSEIDGHLLWAEPVGVAQWDSFSPPTVDVARGHVLMASGMTVTALDMDTGALAWQTTLGTRPVVNSSICVCGSMAYVTDYTGAATGAKLHALNLDPNHPTLAEGAVAWRQSIHMGGGNEVTVAPSSPMLIATDAGGYLRQFSPGGSAGWILEVPGAGGFWPPPTYGAFFGGAAVVDGCIYAATYEFYGYEDSGQLYCVDAGTGETLWAEPAERTDTIPIVTGSLVLLSAGIDGYGSRPKVEAFDRATGRKLWEWTGGGGWSVQPVLVGDILYVGVLPVDDEYAPCTELVALDITRTPDDPGFVIESFPGAGSSPAFANGNLYTIGENGLCAFGPEIILAGAPSVVVTVEDGLDWVYQNTPGIMARGGHRVTLTVTVTDLNGNQGVTVTAAKRPGSGTGEVTVADGATPLEKILFGSDRSLGLHGSLVVDVTVTGDVAGSTTIGVPFTCRKLGDIDGNGGAEPTDMALLVNTLNGRQPADIHNKAVDLDCNGGAEPTDMALLVNILNGMPVY
ncbi:MAG: PQQ-like beta-propeller repeat protein [Phycisphaerae bacterium]|nr:PQQ-like beta-propeller repeat protein [Phycisphaerae bacterium]